MEILEPDKDYSKLKVFDKIRQKHGIMSLLADRPYTMRTKKA